MRNGALVTVHRRCRITCAQCVRQLLRIHLRFRCPLLLTLISSLDSYVCCATVGCLDNAGTRVAIVVGSFSHAHSVADCAFLWQLIFVPLRSFIYTTSPHFCHQVEWIVVLICADSTIAIFFSRWRPCFIMISECCRALDDIHLVTGKQSWCLFLVLVLSGKAYRCRGLPLYDLCPGLLMCSDVGASELYFFVWRGSILLYMSGLLIQSPSLSFAKVDIAVCCTGKPRLVRGRWSKMMYEKLAGRELNAMRVNRVTRLSRCFVVLRICRAVNMPCSFSYIWVRFDGLNRKPLVSWHVVIGRCEGSAIGWRWTSDHWFCRNWYLILLRFKKLFHCECCLLLVLESCFACVDVC